MGILSSSQSISRYYIEGNFQEQVSETIQKKLIQNTIPEIQNPYEEISAGWVSFENPYSSDFEKDSFIFGTYFVFSLRIDKKNIPAKLLQKHLVMEIEKKKAESGRNTIPKKELSRIKEKVRDNLLQQMPFVPNIYNVLWNYEENSLLFFTTQKTVNEFFESLFFKTFELKAIRIFPYTMIETNSRFSSVQKDQIYTLSPVKYMR